MLRRHFCRWLTLSISAFSVRLGFADDPLPGNLTPMPGVTATDLEQTLKFGLKARRPVEFQFISDVVQQVKNKQLPIDLVQSTFLWAKRKKPYQYPYFEKALRVRANDLGYTVPAGAGY